MAILTVMFVFHGCDMCSILRGVVVKSDINDRIDQLLFSEWVRKTRKVCLFWMKMRTIAEDSPLIRSFKLSN